MPSVFWKQVERWIDRNNPITTRSFCISLGPWGTRNIGKFFLNPIASSIAWSDNKWSSISFRMGGATCNLYWHADSSAADDGD